MFWIPGRVFGFWEVFWILGSVLDSGKCFVPMGHGTIQLKPFDPTERFFSVALFCLGCCTNCC